MVWPGEMLPVITDASAWAPAATALRTRKVAIIGFSETARDAPWNDPSWDVWAMNGFWRAAKPDFGIDVPEERYSLWFDTHTIEYTREYGKRAGFGDAQERWLEQPHPFPILMLEECERFPSVRRLPIEAMIQAAGRDYFTSTVAYALAFAATLPDVAEVGLWGIDLVADTEYADQRPCAEYHIRGLEALGVKVTLHERSALLKQRQRYGLPGEPLLEDLRASLRQQEAVLEKAIAKARAEAERAMVQANTDDGALQVVRRLLNRLSLYERGGRI